MKFIILSLALVFASGCTPPQRPLSAQEVIDQVKSCKQNEGFVPRIVRDKWEFRIIEIECLPKEEKTS